MNSLLRGPVYLFLTIALSSESFIVLLNQSSNINDITNLKRMGVFINLKRIYDITRLIE